MGSCSSRTCFLNIATFHINKTCHRDGIAHLTAPCPSHKIVNVKLFANAAAANADANTGSSTIALPRLRPGELKRELYFDKEGKSDLPYMRREG